MSDNVAHESKEELDEKAGLDAHNQHEAMSDDVAHESKEELDEKAGLDAQNRNEATSCGEGIRGKTCCSLDHVAVWETFFLGSCTKKFVEYGGKEGIIKYTDEYRYDCECCIGTALQCK